MTDNDKSLLYGALIQALTFAIGTATKISDVTAFQSASKQLGDMATDIDVPSSLRDVASGVRNSLSENMTDAGLQDMSNAVAQLSGAATALQNAINIAQGGQQALSFPALANAASKALTSFNNLKTATVNVQQDLRTASAAQLGNVPGALTQLVSDLKALQTVVANT